MEPRLQPFLGVTLEVDGHVLVPRAETEILGRRAIALLSEAGPSPRTIDVCCGSGNLACSAAAAIGAARVWATDLTEECVAATRRNVDRLGLSARVEVFQGDLFGGLPGSELAGTIDVVMCNPPYIPSSRLESDRAFLLEEEPREAFDGGPYGLSIHQRVLKEAVTFLKPGGTLLMEFGIGQDRALELLAKRVKDFGSVSFLHDAEGAPRVIVAVKAA